MKTGANEFQRVGRLGKHMVSSLSGLSEVIRAGVPRGDSGESLPLPRELYIESTTRCNESCDQCPRTHLGREADRDITLGEVQQIIEQFPALERVVLHGLGEPLLNKELPAIVAYLRSRDVYTLFNSNALLLNAKRGRALIDAGLNELRVSLDGATPATYARVRGVNEKALPLITSNLKQFQALNATWLCRCPGCRSGSPRCTKTLRSCRRWSKSPLPLACRRYTCSGSSSSAKG